jgi:hypothetical protein
MSARPFTRAGHHLMTGGSIDRARLQRRFAALADGNWKRALSMIVSAKCSADFVLVDDVADLDADFVATGERTVLDATGLPA